MAIKKFKVEASANTKKSVKADKSINERTDDLNRLKQIISDYCENEFGQKVDFSDLKDVGMGYTTYGDYDEWSLEVTADLENCKLIYTTIYPDGTYAENVEQYKDWEEMANVLEDVTFDNLMSLQYFPDLCEDEYLNASCGKKSVKSSTKRRAVKAGTTPWDNVKPLSVGQAKVFTYRGDPCVFVGVPNGMIFRWYPDSGSAKSELNYAKAVIKKFPTDWEESLREYGFDQYDANAEYQTLSAKNPVKSSTKRKPMKKTIKASATSKMKSVYATKASDYDYDTRFRLAGDVLYRANVSDEPHGAALAYYMPNNYVLTFNHGHMEMQSADLIFTLWNPNAKDEFDYVGILYTDLDSADAGDDETEVYVPDRSILPAGETKKFKNFRKALDWLMRQANNKKVGDNVSASMKRQPTKKSIKASASAKRRASKKYVKAYIDEYPDWVYDWSESKTERNKRKYDEKLNEWYDAAESMYPEFYNLRGADRKAAIEEVNKAVGFTMDDVFSSTAVKASIDSDYDTKVLRELEDYIKDNYPIYVDTEYAVYENENDWSVGLFASLGMVESDFEYFLNEQNPYLYNRLTETGLIGGPSVNNAVSANDFQFQLYPAQNQWHGPQLDIDETNLTNAGDDGSVYAELKAQIDAFEIMYIDALQELNYHISDLLRVYDEGQDIHASTDVNADLQLNKYPDDRKKYSYNKNSITDIDGYVQDIADGVVGKFPNLTYEISDEAITFSDENGTIVYVQPIDEIVPEREDLNDDIDELASAIQLDDELNAMQKDFDEGWNATYDEDTATRAVQMATDTDLEPIMGEDETEEDMGFGFTTNGEAISESMVDELCRIANEILEKSELAKIDEYTSIDRDTFDYWCDGSIYVSEKFYIYFTFNKDGNWYMENDMVDFDIDKGWSTAKDYEFECDIVVEDGEVKEVLYNSMPDAYNADMIDVPALTEYIEKLAAPVAMDIYNGTTNI